MVRTEEGLSAAWKPGGMSCPHLSFDGVEASRAVHDRPGYEESPCWTYGNSQVDPDFVPKRGRPCPVGAEIRQRGGFQKTHAHPKPATELKILGPWPSPQDL